VTAGGDASGMSTTLVARYQAPRAGRFTLSAQNWVPTGLLGRALGALGSGPEPTGHGDFDGKFSLSGRPSPHVYAWLMPANRQRLLRLHATARLSTSIGNVRLLTVDEDSLSITFSSVVSADTLRERLDDIADQLEGLI
jgi:hypothetical protein